MLERLIEETRVNVAISLNASDNETRSAVMPVNKKWPIENLIDTLRKFPIDSHRKLTFEYVLLKGVNDTLEDAKRVAKLLNKLPGRVNLIPFNEHPLAPYKQPDLETTLAFQKLLLSKGLNVHVRTTRGDDVDAACGMLGAEMLEKSRISA
jgi:23S rRNA (adenine2503-C2)-methyltransferase